jgi:ABC-type multidrug transport system ATPase subunit
MELIAGRRKDGVFSGEINMSTTSMDMAYIQKVEKHINCFSVLQTLYFNCRLKAGNSISDEKCYSMCCDAARVAEIDAFMLLAIEDLSKYQLKLLSIACALLGSPQVIFLDEPTTGPHKLFLKIIFISCRP